MSWSICSATRRGEKDSALYGFPFTEEMAYDLDNKNGMCPNLPIYVHDAVNNIRGFFMPLQFGFMRIQLLVR